jgi:hypothetical protein
VAKAKAKYKRKSPAKKSAVTKAYNSGLELVAKRRLRGRRATFRDFAKVDWKPWSQKKIPLPSDETVSRLGLYCRIASQIMTRSKAELIESHKKVDHESMDTLMGGLLDTCEKLKALARLVDAAYVRLLTSASAHFMAGGKFKHAR